jgi:hypothetical protein
MAMGLVDEIFDELAKAAKTNRGNGCVGISINPIDGTRQLAKVVESKPSCNCTCKSRSLKFKDIIDDIDSVIFNEPATVVTFNDGTKVCVKACEKDTFSKDDGLMYALVKRLYANDIDDNGYLKSRGLGEKINKVIEGAFDQKKAEAEKRAKLREKAKRKEAAKAKEAESKKLDNLANEVSEQAAKEACEQVYEQKKD